MQSFEAFVLMPFGLNGEYGGGPTESEYVFTEIIEPGVVEAGRHLEQPPRIWREVDSNRGGSITAAIVRGIARADVAVVDITGRNPNVFLELGIRYALRSKVTVLLAQVGTQVPFDIKGYRYIEYDRFKPWEARKRIADAIREGLSEAVTSDSAVFDVLSTMTVTIPGIAESYGVEVLAQRDVMTWDEYMQRIDWTCSYLDAALHEYRFIPAAVIGITNGGLVAADLIGRRVYAGRETPVLSLWARRHVIQGRSEFWYFDNAYNDAMLKSLHSVAKETNASTSARFDLLLIDDHMGTGSTAVQAVRYIQDRLGEEASVTYIPIVSRRLDNIGVVEEYLPYQRQHKDGKPVFSISKDQFLHHLITDATFFPYLRKQVNVSTSG